MNSGPHARAVHRSARATTQALAGLLLLTGCTPSAPALDLGPETNVVLVVIDTLRADRLGLYGHEVPTSPHLDALARESVVFEHAYSPSAWTLPAMVSAMTGAWPNEHDVVARGQRLPPGLVPLAERLRASGRQTAAFVSNPLAATVSGLDRGYDELSRSQRTVPLDAVARWLDERARGPFFLYLHSTEPHLPYAAPDESFRQLGARPISDRDALVKTLRRFRSLTRKAGTRALPGRRLELQRELLAELEPRRDDLLLLYDASVASADANFGALHELLRERDLLDQTLLIVLSDHGEEMLEHGGLLHGQSLYDELVRVPMIWRLPGGASGGLRVSQSVTLVDLVPTLLDVLGHADAGHEAFEGRSFADLLAGTAREPSGPIVTSVRVEREFHYATPAPRGDLNISVVEGPWKGIWNVEPDRFELYRLDRDPGEHDDLSAAEPERTAALRAAVERWFLAQPLPAQAPAPARPIDPDDLERLRVLGYLE